MVSKKWIVMSRNTLVSLTLGILVHTELISQPENSISSMVVLELPGLTDKAGQGAYANVYNALKGEGSIQQWFSAPSKRAHHLFIDGTADCIAPAALDLLDRYDMPRHDFSISAPFNMAVGKVMTAVFPPAKQGAKPVMGVVGFGVQHGVEPDLYRIEDIPDYGKLLQLIEGNRLDAAYIVFPDVEQIPGSLERIKKFKGKVETYWQGVDAVLCWNKGRNTVDRISSIFIDWRKTGYLKSLLGAYYVE